MSSLAHRTILFNYNLEFEVKATISVLFDRSGNYLAITTATNSGEKLQQEGITKSEKPQNEGIASPLFTYVEETETTEAEDIIELTDILKEEIINLTDIAIETKKAA